jgi:L-aspartate oxidase
LAYNTGAMLADLELMQFHPTAVVASNGADGFLVTEAVRGEGATLHDREGNRFVDELLPRDEVARAVQRRMAETRSRSVELDMRHVDPALFPNVVTALKNAGIDPEHERVPVAPAAHYMMGGIATDLDGRTTLGSLYAVGECSCTGLHGANRLASNSLTECFVFGARAAHSALDEPLTPDNLDAVPGPHGSTKPPALTTESREALWRCAGLERDHVGLTKLTHDPYPLVCLIARSALVRTESRGAHQRTDFPAPDPAFDGRHVMVGRAQGPAAYPWT